MYISQQMHATISDLTIQTNTPPLLVFFSEKSINDSAFFESMTTRKRSDIRIYFRDFFPRNKLKIATLINGVVTIYSDPADASAYVSVVGGELIIKAPPGLGNKTMVFTRRHSLFHPNNGKRFSTSLFDDSNQLGKYEIGFGNHSETDLDEHDAILFRSDAGQYSGIIVSNHVEKIWPNGSGTNIVSSDKLNGLELDPKYGHLFDIQAQLRNVGNIYFYLSGKTSEKPREVLKFNGLNNQLNTTVSNAAMHGVFICHNNGVETQIRIGCLDISDETDDDDIQDPVIFSNDFDVTCPQLGGAQQETVMHVIRAPRLISNNLNTQDSQYHGASVYSDKRARVRVYRIDNPALLTKGAGLPIEETDWTPYVGAPLEYIDNSQASGAPRLITGFNSAGLKPIDQAGFAAAGKEDMNPPDVRKVPIILVHGEILVVVGFGRTAAASMSLITLHMGAGV